MGRGEELEAASVGAEALPLPRRAVRTRIFEQLVEVTFEDVHAYFFRDYAERMRGVMRAAIAASTSRSSWSRTASARSSPVVSR